MAHLNNFFLSLSFAQNFNILNTFFEQNLARSGWQLKLFYAEEKSNRRNKNWSWQTGFSCRVEALYHNFWGKNLLTLMLFYFYN